MKNVTTVPLSPVEMVPPAPHSGMVIDALVCLDIMDLTVTWTSMNATVVTTMILVSMEDVSTLMVATSKLFHLQNPAPNYLYTEVATAFSLSHKVL